MKNRQQNMLIALAVLLGLGLLIMALMRWNRPTMMEKARQATGAVTGDVRT